MRMNGSEGASSFRRLATPSLVVLWLFVYGSQLVLYTSLIEIASYSLLGIVVAFALFWCVRRLNPSWLLLGFVFVASLVLGLVPYRIRLNDWALFFFDSAKQDGVTYYANPHWNLTGIVWDAVFPIVHFVLMYAIAWTYKRRDSSGLTASNL